jgi:uncharacterized membrane protein
LLVAFDADGLVAAAGRCEAEVTLVPAPGDFVRSGAPLFRLVESGARMSDDLLRGSVLLGQERTMRQDPAFALRIMVDVAVKALSPAINDPTSAVMAIDQIHELLAYLGTRRLDVGDIRDGSGRLRLRVDMPTWDDYVSLGFDEIRGSAGHQVQVTRRLRGVLEDLLAAVPAERRAAIERELALLAQAVRRSFPDAGDRIRAGQPDAQGLGSSPPLADR